jgi:hypothetical protein
VQLEWKRTKDETTGKWSTTKDRTQIKKNGVYPTNHEKVPAELRDPNTKALFAAATAAADASIPMGKAASPANTAGFVGLSKPAAADPYADL